MDALAELFEKIRSEELSKGLFLGLLHVLIGRTVTSRRRHGPFEPE